MKDRTIINNDDVLQRITELYREYFEVLESFNNEKTFAKLDRLRLIKFIFRELKIHWLDNEN